MCAKALVLVIRQKLNKKYHKNYFHIGTFADWVLYIGYRNNVGVLRTDQFADWKYWDTVWRERDKLAAEAFIG